MKHLLRTQKKSLFITFVFYAIVMVALVFANVYHSSPAVVLFELDFSMEEPIPEEEQPQEEEEQPTEEELEAFQRWMDNSPNLTTRAQQSDNSIDEDIRQAHSHLKGMQNRGDNAGGEEAGEIAQEESTPEKPSGEEQTGGRTTIEYKVGNRKTVYAPPPAFLSKNSGSVTVDVQVNQNGNVIRAKARNDGSLSRWMVKYAEEYARKTTFNTDFDAPKNQSGWIKYVFISR